MKGSATLWVRAALRTQYVFRLLIDEGSIHTCGVHSATYLVAALV